MGLVATKPMTDQLGDPAHHDLAWVGYDPRAGAPAFALATLASALVLTGRWYLVDLSEFADRVGALAVFGLAAAVWPGLLVVFLYRTVTYTYRLTDRAIFVDLGFMSLPIAPIPLAEVENVSVANSLLGRPLGVGWVEVRTPERILRLGGIHNPTAFAEKIQATIAASRKNRA
jgi:membrane protein YdbS with pleckstrin-like domain